MRETLAHYHQQRGQFSGVFVRYGTKPGWTGDPITTLLFREVKDRAGVVVTDHLWFTMTKGFEALGTLQEGEIVTFEARVTSYEKGYKGYRDDIWDAPIETDYRLSRPTKLRKEESHV